MTSVRKPKSTLQCVDTLYMLYHVNTVTTSQSATKIKRKQQVCKSEHYYTHTHTHTHPFNGPLSGTTRVSRYQKSTDFTEARDSEWQWHQLGRMQVFTLLQTDNDASTPPLSFLQAGCPSCHPTNSVKALKTQNIITVLT